MDGDKQGLKCERCAAVLPNDQAFQNHQIIFHTTLYKCRHCQKQFMQSQSLASHCRVVHKDVIKKRQKLLIKKGSSLNFEQCKCCGKPFISLTKLKIHIKKVHMENNEKEIKKEKTEENDRQVLSTREPSFEIYIDTSGTDDPEHHKASTSTFQLNSTARVDAGTQVVVNEEGQMIMKSAEEDGNFSSSSENEDAEETTNVHNETTFKRKRLRTNLNSGVYRCKYCSKTFTLSTSLATHVRCHYAKLREGSIKCGTCFASVSSMAELRSHVNKLHPNGRSYSCGLCGYLTNQIGKFRLHLLYTHMKIQYKCTICNRPFPSNILLKKHYLREHDVKKSGKPRELLRCDHCTFECYTDDELEVHQKVHIKKLNKCDLCKYECYSEDLLARHTQQVHLGFKPVPRAIIKNEVEVISADGTMPTAELLPFFCGMCGSKFPKTEYLLHHITVHIEGKYVFKRNNNGSVLSAGSTVPNKPLDGQVNKDKCGSQENIPGPKPEVTAIKAKVSKGRTSPNHNGISSHSSCSDNLEGDKAKVTSSQNKSVQFKIIKGNSVISDQRKYIILPKFLKVPLVEDNKSGELTSDDSTNDICPSTGWLTEQYTSKPWFECPHCFKFVQDALEFQKHIAAHGSENLISCQICRICKRRFACKMSLQRHKTTHRSNEYQCKCGKGFVSSTLIMAHMKHCVQAGVLVVEK